MQGVQKTLGMQGILDLLKQGPDGLDIMDDDDFETCEDYDAWREDTCTAIYESIRDLAGKDVEQSAYFKLQEFWERVSNVKESLFFTDKFTPSGAHVACVVDTLTRSYSTHQGDPVVILINLV
nr:hypothetical protein [Candidatus Sigynarchaeota archaeon]